jgi:hypothetical protein
MICIATGMNIVAWMAAVLWCAKQMGKLPQLLFVHNLFPKTEINELQLIILHINYSVEDKLLKEW